MSGDINWTALIVFILFFALVTVLGFVASRWKAGDLSQLHEWGLGGRRFGTWITWFLVGGDFYTAYTVIAVPALVFASGAYGFFALPYTIIVYPIVFTIMPRLWAVSKKHHYLTSADFVHGRYGNGVLAFAVAFTGILATMPYIALQLVGMQAVIGGLGIGGPGLQGELPLIIAFVILALYTYSSGLRAPAMIAFVKDIMIYIVVIAAVAVIPIKLGGYAHVFQAASDAFAAKGAGGITLKSAQMVPFASLALGSAMAAFMYPHTMTGVLSSSSGDVVRKNAMLLPAYTILLGLIALLGYMGIAAGVSVKTNTQVVPALFQAIFPDWFVGFSYAAIAIGALVPAAIMSIGAANLFTRNIWKPLMGNSMKPESEAATAKMVSLVVKVGALAFIILDQAKFAIDLQLLGGVWIIQTFPAIVFGLYRTRFNSWALFIGWATGMIVGTWMAYSTGTIKPVYAVALGDSTYSVYIAILAGLLNIVIAVVLTQLFKVLGGSKDSDQTTAADYELASEKA
ncbi:MAG TPA: sodium:solute symporter [Magnetospirillaceae bacterium]|nr:sodium:solute symporter [Magnetospirillaceae bacterium]